MHSSASLIYSHIGPLTDACAIPYLQPPQSVCCLSPTVGRHERPVAEPLRGHVPRPSPEQGRSRAPGRYEGDVDVPSTQGRQTNDSLDVLKVADFVCGSCASVAL